MNQEQVFSLIRQALLVGGGIAVSRGWIADDTMVWAVGGAVALGSSAWALWTRRPVGLIKSTAALPYVAKVVADPAIANGTLADNRKVTAS